MATQTINTSVFVLRWKPSGSGMTIATDECRHTELGVAARLANCSDTIMAAQTINTCMFVLVWIPTEIVVARVTFEGILGNRRTVSRRFAVW
jgi:hypothetical protein